MKSLDFDLFKNLLPPSYPFLICFKKLFGILLFISYYISYFFRLERKESFSVVLLLDLHNK